MTVKPSDIAMPRDDSPRGVAREMLFWLAALLVALAALILGAQIAAVLRNVDPAGWGLRSALVTIGRVLFPVSPTSLTALVIGLGVASALCVAVASAIGSALSSVLGWDKADQQQRDQLDGARLATKREIAPLLVRADQLENRLVLGTPRDIRAPRNSLVAVEAGHSALVVAPTGQGKTESVMVPAILDWDGPVLVVSIKRDVYDLTAGFRGQLGETRVLDPAGLTDPTEVRNAYWTPLAEARSWRAARMLADQMAGVGRKGAQASSNEDYFAKASGELLAGLFFAASHSPVPSMRTVAEWLGDPEDAIPTIEQLLTGMEADESLPDEVRFNAPHALRSIRLRMIGKDPRTVEPIRASAGNILRAWDDYRLAEIEPTDPGVLDPDWLWAAPSQWEQPGDQRTLYVVCPDAEQGTYESLVIGAITQAYNAYGRAGQEGRTLDKPLRIVLDEVANTCPIPKLDTWVTAARGLGINLVIATQNLAQLDTVWGREKAETIASGPRVRMFGPGLADSQTLSYIEKISGEIAVVSETESRHPYALQLATSRSTQIARLPLVPQHAAREIPPFSGLVFYGSIPPFAVNWRAGVNDPHLRRKQRLTPVPPSDAEVRHLRTPRDQRQLVVPVGLEAERIQDEDLDAMPVDWMPESWTVDDELVDDDFTDSPDDD